MNKVNFRQPKYIITAFMILPVMFLAHTVGHFFDNGSKAKQTVVTDSINMSLPDAQNPMMENKMTEMQRRIADDGAYTAVTGIGDDKEQKDTTSSGYSKAEQDRIDKANAERRQQQKDFEDTERRLAESRKHIDPYAGYGRGSRYGSNRSQQDEYADYASEIAAIQRRSEARRKALASSSSSDNSSSSDGYTSAAARRKRTAEKTKQKPAVVEKVKPANEEKFHTIGDTKAQADGVLIRAMIDKTTKAHEGTRLRFKLLDDVTIKGTTLKKGTYLYGIVTGFGQQRVKAEVKSILVKDKFINVALSVYDNDGMEGFYVPESAFRDMMKDARAQAMQNNITFDTGSGSELSGEAIALQALQNMYQSASNAVAGNMRKNKARIKYNTIVYLINSGPTP